MTLTDAASWLPRRRGGRKVHVATLYRWSASGLGGVLLETTQVGGTRCTSAEALQRFCSALTERRAKQDAHGLGRVHPQISSACPQDDHL